MLSFLRKATASMRRSEEKEAMLLLGRFQKARRGGQASGSLSSKGGFPVGRSDFERQGLLGRWLSRLAGGAKKPSTIQAEKGHVLAAGAARTGKTAGIAIPSLLSHMGSAVVFDLGGEILFRTAKWRAAPKKEGPIEGLGQELSVVDPFGAIQEREDPIGKGDEGRAGGTIRAAEYYTQSASALDSLAFPNGGRVGKEQKTTYIILPRVLSDSQKDSAAMIAEGLLQKAMASVPVRSEWECPEREKTLICLGDFFGVMQIKNLVEAMGSEMSRAPYRLLLFAQSYDAVKRVYGEETAAQVLSLSGTSVFALSGMFEEDRREVAERLSQVGVSRGARQDNEELIYLLRCAYERFLCITDAGEPHLLRPIRYYEEEPYKSRASNIDFMI